MEVEGVGAAPETARPAADPASGPQHEGDAHHLLVEGEAVEDAAVVEQLLPVVRRSGRPGVSAGRAQRARLARKPPGSVVVVGERAPCRGRASRHPLGSATGGGPSLHDRVSVSVLPSIFEGMPWGEAGAEGLRRVVRVVRVDRVECRGRPCRPGGRVRSQARGRRMGAWAALSL